MLPGFLLGSELRLLYLVSVLGAIEKAALQSLTLWQWQVKPGGGPAVASQDPPWEQGWLWQGSISTSHHGPVVGMGFDVTRCFGHCLLSSSFLGDGPALAAEARASWGTFSGLGCGAGQDD